MMAANSYIRILLSSFVLLCNPVFAITTVVYRSPESEVDARYSYDLQLLELALQSTKITDGDYRLEASSSMTFARARAVLNVDGIKNFIVKLSYEPVYKKNLTYASFPVDLGIVGYRVCFTSRERLKELKKVLTMDTLLKYSHGVGLGWADEKILRDNGFKVISSPRYDSLFRMVAANRFDLFCRGVNEVLEEFKSHQDLENFALEQSFVIYYPLPRFYYGHANSSALLKRIERGLKIAYENGTLQELWEKYYRPSIEFAKLEQRYLFQLENSLVTDLDPSYQKYIYRILLEDKPSINDTK